MSDALEWGDKCRIVATVNQNNSLRSVRQQQDDWLNGGSWCVSTSCGRYTIQKWEGSDAYDLVPYPGVPLGPFGTMEEAKTAAQADCIRREAFAASRELSKMRSFKKGDVLPADLLHFADDAGNTAYATAGTDIEVTINYATFETEVRTVSMKSGESAIRIDIHGLGSGVSAKPRRLHIIGDGKTPCWDYISSSTGNGQCLT